jgi:hypothetical protein
VGSTKIKMISNLSMAYRVVRRFGAYAPSLMQVLADFEARCWDDRRGAEERIKMVLRKVLVVSATAVAMWACR